MAPLSPPDATNESQSNQAQLSRLVSQLELNKNSNYVLNILYYISGFIVAKLMKQVKCSSCIGDLTGTCTTTTPSEHDYCKQANPGHVSGQSSFSQFINSGSLKIPSKFVVDVVQYAEHIFKLYVSMNVDQINTKKNINTKMVMEVCQHFGQVATNLLPPLHQVSLHDEPLIEEDHRLWLLKCVANCYLKIRLFTYAKTYCETVINFGKPSNRLHLTKMILFHNQ